MMKKQDNQKRENHQDNLPNVSRKMFFKRNQGCPFGALGDNKINYKDVELLKKFVSERGKIMPRRIIFSSAKRQRELALAVKRARFLALMPYTLK